MLHASDAFIEMTLTKSFRSSSDSSNHAVQAIDWSVCAKKLHLTKSLEFCEVWLIKKFKKFPNEFAKLFVLDQKTIVKIMRKVAEALPSGGCYY